MSVAFRIEYGWEPRETPRDVPHDSAQGWPPLYRELIRFLAEVDGEFRLWFGTDVLDFDLSPDLETVFERLPDVLEQLAGDMGASAGLHFFAQGTEVLLMLRRERDDIVVEVHAGPSAGQRFRGVHRARYVVDAGEFVVAWVRFLRAVLDAMRARRPPLEREAAFQEFVARLAAAETATRPRR